MVNPLGAFNQRYPWGLRDWHVIIQLALLALNETFLIDWTPLEVDISVHKANMTSAVGGNEKELQTG